jgi:2-dehydropantoate 2-reductase
MRIAVVGAGGVGGTLGALLARQGQDVSFVARGAHLEALQARGLRLRGMHGDFTLAPVRATSDPRQIGEVDVVLIAVKHYDLPSAMAAIPPLLGPSTTLVPLLNGIDAHEDLASAFGAAHVIGGSVRIVARVDSPGVIVQEGSLLRVVIGELDGSISDRAAALHGAWVDAGVEAVLSSQILSEMWSKFIYIASLGGLTALSGETADQIVSDTWLRGLFERAMREAEVVARAAGVPLPDDLLEGHLDLTASLPPGTMTSMQRDVAAGRRFELEAFSGAVVRRARIAGLDVPVHAAIYALLRPRLLRASLPHDAAAR